MAQSYLDGTPFTQEDIDRFLGTEALAYPLLGEGVFIRLSMDNGDPVLCVSPPLVAGQEEFDVLFNALDKVIAPLNEAYLLGPQ